MKAEDAILTLKNQINADADYVDEETCQAAIEALERQIPKKVNVDEYGWWECPNHCEYTLVKKYDKHCLNCGQALKWRD